MSTCLGDRGPTVLTALREVAAESSLDEEGVERVLRFARLHLAMEVAWISRTGPTGQVIELVDGAGAEFGLRLGDCLDTPPGPEVRPGRTSARATLRFTDGTLYGFVGCLSNRPRPPLQGRDDEFLQLVAALLAPSLDAHERDRHRRAAIGARTQAVLDCGGPQIVYQPIAMLPGCQTVAFEASSRFPAREEPAGPDIWFAEAAEVGLGTTLELAAVRGALSALDWTERDLLIAVNVSARTLQEPAFTAELQRHDARRVIVELTEHEQVADYARLRCACRDLRDLGCRIAVDDAGAGYAGFQHLIEVRPDIIKLDRSITHAMDADRARAAMAAALVGFAEAIDATVVAEGVETSGELRAAVDLGIHHAQGYFIGRPHLLPGPVHVVS